MADETVFRCCGCGKTCVLPVSASVLTITRSRGGGPPCESCGAISWVQAGSMTEFYRFWQRPDVCRVGEHIAEGVRRYDVVPVEPPAGGVLQVTSVVIQACPEHAALLRDGYQGYILRS